MSEILNLRRARKLKERAAAERKAAENRVRSGRSKGEKMRAALDAEQTRARLDGAKRDRDDSPRRD